MSTTRPTPGTPRAYEFPQAERLALATGLRVIVAPMHRLPLVTVLAVVDAGAAGDAPGQEGLAQLTASALAEGTATRDAVALADALERIGTAMDSGAGWDDATVRLTVTPARLEAAFALLAEVLTSPRFAEADIERLKAERLADLLQQRVEPRALANEHFARVVHAEGSRYAVSPGGTPASVRRLTAAQVRAWHAARFTGATTTIIVAGDVRVEEIRALVERNLGSWQGRATPRSAVVDTPRTTQRGVYVVSKPNAQQTELRVGHVGLPRRHPDYFKVVVMNAILGGLFGSRINLNLRERHAYTYGAHSAFDWRRAAGPFEVDAAVKNEVTADAVREILHEIDAIRSAPVTRDELELATHYLGGVFPIRYETTGAVAGALASANVYGLPDDYFSTYRERIASVTVEDVQQMAQAHLHPEQLQILAAGDPATIATPLEQLGLGTPMVITPDEEES